MARRTNLRPVVDRAKLVEHASRRLPKRLTELRERARMNVPPCVPRGAFDATAFIHPVQRVMRPLLEKWQALLGWRTCKPAMVTTCAVDRNVLTPGRWTRTHATTTHLEHIGRSSNENSVHGVAVRARTTRDFVDACRALFGQVVLRRKMGLGGRRGALTCSREPIFDMSDASDRAIVMTTISVPTDVAGTSLVGTTAIQPV